MAHYVEEGNTSTGDTTISTAKWLQSNNLGHLIPTFKQNKLELSELMEMDENSLVEILKAMGLDAISIPRIKSKIMQLKNNNNNNNNNGQQPQIQQIIITEAEQTAMKSLNNKFEELKGEQKVIRNALSEIEKEHNKQQQLVKSSMEEIKTKIEERTQILLTEMNEKVQEYKNKLNQLLQQNENNYKSLTKTLNEYNYNIKESAESSSLTSVSMDVLEKRSNKNVLMIDNILLNIKMQSNNNKNLKSQHIVYDIDKFQIICDINGCGKVKLVNDAKYNNDAINNDDVKEDIPTERGIVGLHNLGNTSFINSIIQCLAQSPMLTEYFLKNDYIQHINKNNPDGSGGHIAKEWALLLYDIFSKKYNIISPKQFRLIIGKVAPQFIDDEEKDAFQLLSFLLNVLHEDLNQIEKKPETEPIESKQRSDEIVAMESWKTFLRRNQSVMIDMIAGQQKSKIVCTDCEEISVVFESYMSLSVPIPTAKTHKIVEYTWIDSDTSIPPTVYGIHLSKVADIAMLKESVAKRHGVSKDDLFVCDIWKSSIHRQLRKDDVVNDINTKSDDIFIYHSKTPNTNQWKGKAIKGKREFQTFLINNQHRVIARQEYMHGGQKRYEDKPIGYPLLVILPMKIEVTMNQIRIKLWQLIQPLLHDKNLKIDDDNLPFEFWAAWGFNNHAKIRKNNDEIFDLNQKNLKFLIHWKDPKQYKSELYDIQNRPRDNSAPPPLDPNKLNQHETQTKTDKAMDLSACIAAFCEKRLISVNDEWICAKCKNCKYATKKIDLWSSPDLLIIHLGRFMETDDEKERINTLIKFPIEGLDLAPFLVSKGCKKDAIYDLYAVLNHESGMDGDHYTAYVKSLDNKQWYYLNDSKTLKVTKPQNIVTSAAYILYYQKQKPRKMRHRVSRIRICV